MRKEEIANEFGFINGVSVFSYTSVIESKLYEAMDKYAQEKVNDLIEPPVYTFEVIADKLLSELGAELWRITKDELIEIMSK